ncbi:MAG: hypothetical protein COU81_02895 [Candidatus Portnoybacteria bacterium CG10_big_fil_rev_8_21_14_0_10_36_7]|uniref:PPM-type phosphatase domain-containing protein n=1 Tax=Candidatus Portnoybacteria bacterium CG10_big_fil_rev_8_21_14_0_10_36_7 TaxID=1974812 RepID=A0A2M8KDQ3_9BACT|nr:MAG: hypothetical protein COU81_02895 [Candidatus Portnoybacteria bacterium CG10_big_fil_rev_8_21_14_0_10_36_7]
MEKKHQDFKAKSNVLLFNHTRKGSAKCEIFQFEPQNIEQIDLGNLYIVGQLIDPNDESKFLLNTVSSVIKKEYYANPKRGTLKSLEMALHKANLALGEIAHNGQANWVNNLNIICASLSDDAVNLVKAGQGQAFLWRDNTIIDLGKRFIISDEKKPNPNKTFKSVASGQAVINDKLILASPTILDLISPVGLEQLLNDNTISTCTQIENIAKEQPALPSLVLLLLELRPPGDNSPVYNSNLTRGNNRLKTSTNKEKIFGTFNVIQKLHNIFSIPTRVISSLKNKMEATELPKVTINYGGAPNQQKPKLSRNHLFALLGITILALSGFAYSRYLSNSQQALDNYKRVVEEITIKQNEAENALIFNDTFRASEMLSQAKNLYANIVGFNIKQQESEDIANKINTKIDEINKITHLNDLIPITDFSAPGFEFSPQYIFVSEGSLYAWSDNSEVSYTYSLAKQNGRYVLTPPTDKLINQFTTTKETYKLNDSKYLKRTSPGKKLNVTINIYPPITSNSLFIANKYSDNIYIIDPNTERISIINRSGELISQIISDSLKSLTNFAFSEDEKAGFAISQNQLFQIDLINQ